MTKIGIPQIDEEHQELVNLLTSIQFSKSKTTEDYLFSLIHISDVIFLHFVSEERFMRDNHYPYCVLHQQEHNRLIDVLKGELLKFFKCSETEKFQFHLNFIQVLQEAITVHIDSFDSHIGTFYSEKTK